MRLKKSATLVAITLTALLAMSCGKKEVMKEVPTPNNQTINKLHEDPVKAEFLLQECHTHGPSTWHGNGVTEETKYLKTTQKITYVLEKATNSKGTEAIAWKPAKDSPDHFVIRSGNDYGEELTKKGHGGTFYSLVIKYYNSEDKDITYQFVTNGQERIHQHFFIPVKGSVKKWDKNGEGEEMKDLPKDKNGVIDIFRYWYMDTDPHDKLFSPIGQNEPKSKLIGNEDPRGFKGVFQVNDFAPKKKEGEKVDENQLPVTYCFDMNIRLMHSLTSKYDPKKTRSKTSTPSPYNAPSPAQLQTDVYDLTTKLHFVVFASRSEYIDDDEITSFAEVTDPNEKDYILRYSKAWGCTPDEAVKDVIALLEGNGTHVSANI